MGCVRPLSRRPGRACDLLGTSRIPFAHWAGFIAVLALAFFVAAPASAQGSYSDRFTSPTWEHETSGTARSVRSVRRGVTTTTSLEEFDVPARAQRSRARTSRTYTTQRVVTRTTSPRRVRYAAISRNDAQFIEVAPQQQRARRANSAVRSSEAATMRSAAAPLPSLTGGGIAWRASSACLASNLRAVVASVAARFGHVTVNSTCRSASHNRRVGGARRSWHLTGNAVDFRVRGARIAQVAGYLRSLSGGYRHYGGGLFHIDNGPKRTF